MSSKDLPKKTKFIHEVKPQTQEEMRTLPRKKSGRSKKVSKKSQPEYVVLLDQKNETLKKFRVFSDDEVLATFTKENRITIPMTADQDAESCDEVVENGIKRSFRDLKQAIQDKEREEITKKSKPKPKNITSK